MNFLIRPNNLCSSLPLIIFNTANKRSFNKIIRTLYLSEICNDKKGTSNEFSLNVSSCCFVG